MLAVGCLVLLACGRAVAPDGRAHLRRKASHRACDLAVCSMGWQSAALKGTGWQPRGVCLLRCSIFCLLWHLVSSAVTR